VHAEICRKTGEQIAGRAGRQAEAERQAGRQTESNKQVGWHGGRLAGRVASEHKCKQKQAGGAVRGWQSKTSRHTKGGRRQAEASRQMETG
jgi:hypothetical protein